MKSLLELAEACGLIDRVRALQGSVQKPDLSNAFGNVIVAGPAAQLNDR